MSNNPRNNHSFAAIFGATITLSGMAGAAALFFGLKFGAADYFIAPEELRNNYIRRTELSESYLSLAKVSSDYLNKSDIEKNYVSVDKVNSLYVPKAEYQQLQKQLASLVEKVSAIPTPFRPLTIEMTKGGNWTDERLGVSIRMAGYSLGPIYSEVDFFLTLPDSAEHKETLDSRESLPGWTFRKNNREFRVSVLKIMPTTFVIKEIGVAG
ncbi:hypothetical protein N4P55_13405 [Pseudomonas fluorescens]|uniref:hypothetical protein n=1 Tax=Pseudomonas fluorescens TaxID=294 RepID=UPI0021CF8ECB|nr:hypothetical protein [Pseudomonas fluorescens]UXV22308.1 hypothetical protein N4P55_13405 [Pseudomonas fluorescens]